MDQEAVNETVDQAAEWILLRFLGGKSAKATDIAELVKVLNLVHSNGYKHGLHQGHYDYQPGGVFNPDPPSNPARLIRRPEGDAGAPPAQPGAQ